MSRPGTSQPQRPRLRDRRILTGEIQARTLITVGKYDELSPTCAETLRQGIAGSRAVHFEHSSHTAHLEETDAYLAVIRAFLADVDTGR
jgi:pimeloyl-ACP methyl ester carboxylesterase